MMTTLRCRVQRCQLTTPGQHLSSLWGMIDTCRARSSIVLHAMTDPQPQIKLDFRYANTFSGELAEAEQTCH